MRLLEERPEHLLSSDYVSWEDLLAHAFDSAVGELEDASPPGVDVPWGEAHQVVIQHPISRVAPFLSRFLDMPREPLPGDSMTIRVGGPGFGASQRTVVSPGHEEDGILHIPTGQSGHFMSRFYRKGHSAWVNGDPSPLLASEAEYTLKLVP
jgi:penicillin amidase